MNRPHFDIAWHGEINSISFSPYRKDDDALIDKEPPPESIDKDLALIAPIVNSIRLYTAKPISQMIPAMATKYNLSVTAGAWISGALSNPNLRLDKSPEQMNSDELNAYQIQMCNLISNEEEINNVITMARKNFNIKRIIVGNETILSGQTTVFQLIRYIRQIKTKITLPISTAEPASVWLSHPELVREVDFIALHVLPYWEGISAEDAVDFVFGEYDNLKRIYPDKHIMLAEIGWPSAGKWRHRAEPSVINQALFLRRFLNRATKNNINYNIIEAFDQPWKRAFEWTVGTHWGIWDANRNQKFSMVEPVLEMKQWPIQAIAATILAIIPVIWFLYNWRHLHIRGKIFFAALVQGSASLIIWTMSIPMIRDFAPSPELMYSVLLPAQLILLVIVLIAGYEITELTWVRQIRRKFTIETSPIATSFPKVSLHLPCYNEPPDMVKLTIDSLNALDYPDFEVLVIDNNTKNSMVWKPIQDYCKKLGSKFHFYHLEKWPGAKAGALNFALAHTDLMAEVIGVIDSDYRVNSDWLKILVPYFENPKVGWVQAPQDHREWELDLFKEFINWEYAGFFDIGMIAKNEDNAIVQHGTMTLINRKALEETGKWAEWTIAEDAELGLRLLKSGYESVYLDHSFVYGLTPDNFTDYKKQRFRWAYGACQILKHHWRTLIPFRNTGLTASQKYHFITGWLPWFADALYVIFTILSVFWTIGLITSPQIFDFPLAIFVMPTVGVFVAKIIHHQFLYSTRVKCNWRQRIGSAIASMSLTYYIGRAMLQGIFTKNVPFLRTPKCDGKVAWTAGFMMASEETIFMFSQWICIALILFVNGWDDLDTRIWILMLIVQSIPYLTAFIMALISAMPTECIMRWLLRKSEL
jgi:exo-beta-1,3-glucanase (GH17 family)/glycosyltransferase involved in cell wall biosynthesis